jgi:hypothetical protein
MQAGISSSSSSSRQGLLPALLLTLAHLASHWQQDSAPSAQGVHLVYHLQTSHAHYQFDV